jgi:hypothetical protein
MVAVVRADLLAIVEYIAQRNRMRPSLRKLEAAQKRRRRQRAELIHWLLAPRHLRGKRVLTRTARSGELDQP